MDKLKEKEISLPLQQSNQLVVTMSTKPEYQQYEEFQNRQRKLSEIRELGIEPYPHKFIPTHTAQELSTQYADLAATSEEAMAGTAPYVTLAGRLVLFRSMGKNAFAHLQDESGRIQVMFNTEATQLVGYSSDKAGGQSPYKFIEKKFDLGDIIGVSGHLFRTMKGELTILVKEATLLCKTLLPLPEKHSGLADKEMRYRKRWLDLICNSDVRDTFQKRSQILRLIRDFLAEQQFVEVETPVIQSSYGGAEARPFTTILNALDQQMFLRISLEIALKKLIVGGIPRLYEIGKVFRNEGIDRTHNPEFTMLEAYAAYWDYNDMMKLVETLFEKIALTLYGSTKVAITTVSGESIEVDMKAPWKRISMKDSIREYGGVDVDSLSDEQLRKLLIEKGEADPLVVNRLPRGLLLQAAFEAFVEEHLVQPHHIIDHPIETTPLCKLHRDPELRAAGYVERFESFIMGQEVCNSYSELNDPELQRTLLEKQAALKDAGNEEAAPLDEEFIEAICQGMPPTGGVGIGIDRLVMMFTNAASIRDVLYFPWMK